MRNASGTITTGNAAQVLAAADAGRIGYYVENLSTGDLWINDLGSAATLAQPSLRLPAGIMSTHGVLRILPLFSATSSANTKVYRVKLGASVIWAAAITTSRLIQPLIVIRNVGAANLQNMFSDSNVIGLGALAAAATSFNENTANALNLTITVQVLNAADFAFLNGYTVELMV